MADKNKTPAYVEKAIKWLESRSPEGESLAFINPEEARLLKEAGGSGEKAVGGIRSYETYQEQWLKQQAAKKQAKSDADFIAQLKAAAQEAKDEAEAEADPPSPFTGGAGALSGAEALGAFPSPVPTTPAVPKLEVPTLSPGVPGQELIKEEGLEIGEQPTVLPPAIVPETGVAQPSPTRVPSAATEAAKVADTGAAAAAAQAAPTRVIGDIQEAIPTEELAEAATADLDPKATLQFQLGEITSSIKEGQPLPLWAAPAARNADSVMLQRGLGASSMAASARTQALLEAGLPIASADAQAYGRIQLQNLNNKQATALQNSNNLAAMRTQNLNARLTGAVNNAQNFLAIDTANLTNQQAANTLSYNAFTQGLFTDQAAENASRQFNATTENQVEQFFSTLETSVEESNANRLTAVRQFNAGEVNAHEQFYENQKLARETFNSNMEASVRAANANWQRSVSTINNANQLMSNTFASQAALGLSEREYQFLWQRHRDDASYIFQSTEAGLDRDAQTAALAQQAAIATGNQNASKKGKLFDAIGAIIAGMFAKSSDIRLKSNIEKIGELNSVINLYRWEWNEVADQIGVSYQPTVGVLAQELIEYRPDLVSKGYDGYYTVNYSGLV